VHKSGLFALVLGGLLVSPLALAQQTTATPAAAPQAAPADDPNEVICHSGEPILGSRFPGPRQCHTRKEWDRIKQDSQEALFHQQMQRSCNAGTNC
jgi:hypothetical protein